MKTPTPLTISQQIMNPLKKAGETGMTCKELSRKTGITPAGISVWFSSARGKAQAERIQPGRYKAKLKPSKTENKPLEISQAKSVKKKPLAILESPKILPSSQAAFLDVEEGTDGEALKQFKEFIRDQIPAAPKLSSLVLCRIPVKTLENWKYGHRYPPPWVMRLLMGI